MNKKKIKQVLGMISAILFGGLLGIGIGYMGKNAPSNYTSIGLLPFILTTIFTYMLLIAIHELTHFISFIRQGIAMRAIIIGMLLFIKEDGHWKFHFHYNPITAMGGIAIPYLGLIKDEVDFKKVQIAYANAIIAAPRMSMLVGVLIAVLGIPILILSPVGKPIILVFIVMGILISMLIVISSRAQNDQAIGDFPAYNLAKTDDFFVSIELYQYAIFTEDYEIVRKENKYVKDKILEGVSKAYKIKKEDVFTISAIDILLVEYLIGIIVELPSVVSDYVNYFLENIDKILGEKTMEQHKVFYYHCLYLLKQTDSERAINIFYQNRVSLDKEVNNYYIKQAEHILGIANQEEFLMNKKNIKTSSLYRLFRIFDGYYADELLLSAGIVKKY